VRRIGGRWEISHDVRGSHSSLLQPGLLACQTQNVSRLWRHCRRIANRLRELTGRTPQLAEISEYYTLMTEEQRFAVIRANLDEQEEIDHMLLAMVPSR